MDEQEREPVTNCVTERRIGRFSVTAELLDAIPDDGLAVLFASFVIVRAEHLFHIDAFEYVAYSPLFAVAQEGNKIPEYMVSTTIADGKTSVAAFPWTGYVAYQAANKQALDEIAAMMGGTR